MKNLLTEIRAKDAPSLSRPSVPLNFSSLFTGSSGSPQLGKELELEFESADRIDLLVSFVKNSGLNLILPSLTRFVKRGGKLRLITTTYMGASDPTAIDRLSRLPNTEIKVSYDTRSSRLHAKAYFIHRNSGLSSAYIGSANLSRAAITDGLEWTLKIPSTELPDLFRRCEAEFETYWESDAFHLYKKGDLEAFTKASNAEKTQTSSHSQLLTIFELSPRDYQQGVLDSLEIARTHRKHFRNLVVAATGTGKTMIAAFDYKNQCAESGPRPKLLFLVHRKEILHQALTTFRQVLKDGNFGELLVDGSQPSSLDYLFCSVASFHSRNLSQTFPCDHWNIVILDEAHHAEARSYRTIVEELKPQILLGLTATPERTDGVSVAKNFDYPLAAEIRLPDALEKRLLCPFHYYAISDNIDLSGLQWKRGRYEISELENVLTRSDTRVDLIISKLVEYLPSPLHPEQFDSAHVKGLGFCVSKKHARYMAKKFNQAGIASACLDSDCSAEERESNRQRLLSGELNFIFVVDIYNEGVDLPAVNTILFLRPTESHVIYLQQFGRGLRHSPNKENLIVLDFIGKSRREFRFDLRLKSLLPGKRNDLRKEIEHGFPHLPAGCYINFERAAKERIFENIRQTYLNIDLRIKESFSQWHGGPPPTFLEFITETGEDPITLLTKRTWSDWKDNAGFKTIKHTDQLAPELNSQARLTLVNSPSYLKFAELLTRAETRDLQQLSTHPYATSFYYLTWNKKGSEFGFTSLTEAFETIRNNSRYLSDLKELVDFALSKATATPLPKSRLECPLELHGIYSRQEIFAAFSKASLEEPSSNREGVMHLHNLNASLHLFTFKKTEKFFSETTSYRDYPISRKLLHWESQSNTSQSSAMGQRYLSQPETEYTVLLFARIESKMGKLASPLVFLGPACLISAKGNKPIEMVWELEHPMPYDFYIDAKRAAGVS
jgi:superfamily II DNA or RNA helicase